MIIDGKQLAHEIAGELAAHIAGAGKKLRLAIVLVGEDPRSLVFVRQKEKFASMIGCDTRIYKFPTSISTSKLRAEVSRIVHIPQNHGVIVQLPLPDHINEQNILNAVVPTKDVDVLSARAVGDAIESNINPTARKRNPCRKGSANPATPSRMKIIPTASMSIRFRFLFIRNVILSQAWFY